MNSEQLLKRYGAVPVSNQFSTSELQGHKFEQPILYVVEVHMRSEFSCDIVRIPTCKIRAIPLAGSSDGDMVIFLTSGVLELFNFPLAFLKTMPTMHKSFQVSVSHLYLESDDLQALLNQSRDG
jgi:hypothetical protein